MEGAVEWRTSPDLDRDSVLIYRRVLNGDAATIIVNLSDVVRGVEMAHPGTPAFVAGEAPTVNDATTLVPARSGTVFLSR